MRFFYGLPFALAWLVVAWLAITPGRPLPAVTVSFLMWTVVASLTQIAATALLLRCMEERNFALGVAYAKTDVIQVALFGFVLLGDRIGAVALAAILVATAGVVLVSLPSGARSVAAIAQGWTSRAALLGLGSGAAFAMAAVGYRGAALTLATPSIVIAAAYSLVWAMEPVAHVRTLGLVELYFSYVVSQRFFRERLSPRELAGFILLALGLVGILAPR